MADSVAELQKFRANLPADTPENASVREDLLLEARKLIPSLERQDNAIESIIFQVNIFYVER